MTLGLVVALKVLFAAILLPCAVKATTGMPGRVTRLWWQYFFTALAASTFFAFHWEYLGHYQVLCVMLMGVGNSFACYMNWRAVDISQSKTALFSPAEDLLAIFLAALILGEWGLLTPPLWFGIGLCAFATILLLAPRESQGITGTDIKRLIRFVVTCSVIWGIIVFLMRFMATGDLPRSAFLAGFYLGSFFGATIIRIRSHVPAGERPSRRGLLAMMGLALLIMTHLYLTYWSYELAPIVVLQPIYQVARVLGPLVLGLYLFGERRAMRRVEWAAVGSGCMGAITLAVYM